jgi:hypothetical protein
MDEFPGMAGCGRAHRYDNGQDLHSAGDRPGTRGCGSTLDPVMETAEGFKKKMSVQGIHIKPMHDYLFYHLGMKSAITERSG